MRLNTGGTVSGQAMNAERPRQSRTLPVRHALATINDNDSAGLTLSKAHKASLDAIAGLG